MENGLRFLGSVLFALTFFEINNVGVLKTAYVCLSLAAFSAYFFILISPATSLNLFLKRDCPK